MRTAARSRARTDDAEGSPDFRSGLVLRRLLVATVAQDGIFRHGLRLRIGRPIMVRRKQCAQVDSGELTGEMRPRAHPEYSGGRVGDDPVRRDQRIDGATVAERAPVVSRTSVVAKNVE